MLQAYQLETACFNKKVSCPVAPDAHLCCVRRCLVFLGSKALTDSNLNLGSQFGCWLSLLSVLSPAPQTAPGLVTILVWTPHSSWITPVRQLYPKSKLLLFLLLEWGVVAKCDSGFSCASRLYFGAFWIQLFIPRESITTRPGKYSPFAVCFQLLAHLARLGYKFWLYKEQ